jgi:isopropylmalate/homocitrate/citramalate synthase
METMERPFRRQCIGVAVSAGATRIAVSDSTGAMKTAAYVEMVRDIVQFVESRAIVSASCHNVSGRAVHNALAAVEAGARQVETTAGEIGTEAGCTPLEGFVDQARGRFDVVAVDRRAAASIAALMPANSAPAPAQTGSAAREMAAVAAPCPDWYCRVEVAAL